MFNKAVFIDKDGTLIEDIPYNVDPDQIKLNEGVKEGLKLLQTAGFKLIIVSNQPGVALGRFRESSIIPVQGRIRQLLAESGITLDGFYYCPHHPEGKVEGYSITCFCRKPSPGMLFQAARDHNVNLANSWLIGDILDDMEAGRRVDSRTILIDNGNETEWRMTSQRRPHHTVKNMAEAAKLILDEESKVLEPPAPSLLLEEVVMSLEKELSDGGTITSAGFQMFQESRRPLSLLRKDGELIPTPASPLTPRMLASRTLARMPAITSRGRNGKGVPLPTRKPGRKSRGAKPLPRASNKSSYAAPLAAAGKVATDSKSSAGRPAENKSAARAAIIKAAAKIPARAAANAPAKAAAKAATNARNKASANAKAKAAARAAVKTTTKVSANVSTKTRTIATVKDPAKAAVNARTKALSNSKNTNGKKNKSRTRNTNHS